MVPGSTQPLTEMSTRNLLGVQGGRPARKADVTAICEGLEKCKSLDVSQPYGPQRPVTGIALPLPYIRSHSWPFMEPEGTALNILF
jgi:hypothetical protein